MANRGGVKQPHVVSVDAILSVDSETADAPFSEALPPEGQAHEDPPPLGSLQITSTKGAASPREVVHTERVGFELGGTPVIPTPLAGHIAHIPSKGSDLMSTGDASPRYCYGGVQEYDEVDRHSLGPQLTDALESSIRNGSVVTVSGQSYTSLGRAAFHIFKGNVGTGVFLLPAYYRDAGYAVGVAVVLFVGWLIIDCVLALIHAKQRINHTGAHTYPAVVKHVLGNVWMHFTKFSLLFTQFGFCVVYIQYASSLFAKLVSGYDLYVPFVLISTIVVTFMTFLSHRLTFLAYMSMTATMFVVVVLTGATMEEVHSLSTTGVATGVSAFVPTLRIFLFISGHIFSLEGIGVVLPIENSISPENHPRFEKVVAYVNASIVALYVSFGVLGYLAYGETLESSVVLAMPASLVKTLMQVQLGLSLIFGYPIQFVPAIQLLDRALGIEIHKGKPMFITVRATFNIFVGAIAATIGAETIGLFAGFLGAFTGIHLMVTLPALLALFTGRVEAARDAVSKDCGSSSAELTFCDYITIFFTLPDNPLDYRWYVYIVFSLVVWVSGIYFTFVSVLS